MQRDINYLSGHFDDYTIIDVRTPAEYASGHIPGAVNIPLFDNDQRAEIGTLYKKVGKEAAILRGLDIVGPKMSSIVNQAKQLESEKRLLVHCWRGGMRSSSVGWLLQTAGIDNDLLTGGYKEFRRETARMIQKLKLVVLGGMTGSGKTEILQELSRQGHQVLDLETMANHRGSAFGFLGMDQQPTSEQFTNDLFPFLISFDFSKPVWIEDESRNIGKVTIPDDLWQMKVSAQKIVIQIDHTYRLDRLVAEYGKFSKEELIKCFLNIAKRLGGQQLNDAVQFLENDQIREAASVALHYYDKGYQYSIEKNKNDSLMFLSPKDQNTPKSIAEELAEMRQNIQV